MLSSLALVLLPSLSAAVTIDCKNIVESKVKWDLSALSGPHSVHQLEPIEPEPNYRNITYTIDLCQALKENPKGCGQGTRVCRTKRLHTKDDGYDPLDPDPKKLPDIQEAYSIAGEFSIHGHGSALDPHVTRLKDSDSHEDAQKEGLRIRLSGGLDPSNEFFGKTTQKAVIEFVCDRDRSGNEGPGWKKKEERSETGAEYGGKQIHKDKDGDDDDDKDDDKDGDDDGALKPLPNPDEGASLQFVGYEVTGEKGKAEGTLRLEWRTRHACEDAIEKPDPDEEKPSRGSSGWGFFTWFIIILFLAIAAYLIFGSWLNYNRYGARGWDLLPHGDTIRDVPYLLKDWARRVFSGGNFGSSRDMGYIRV